MVRAPVWHVQANTDVEMSFLFPLEMGKILWGRKAGVEVARQSASRGSVFLLSLTLAY